MKLVLGMRCDDAREAKLKVGHNALIKEMVASGIVGAGLGSVAGLPGAVGGGLGGAAGAALNYLFKPPVEIDNLVDKDLVILCPEYFVAGNCPDSLFTSEGRIALKKVERSQIGQIYIQYIQTIYPCERYESNQLNNDELIQAIGALFEKDIGSTRELLKTILSQNNLIIDAQAEAYEDQHDEQDRINLVLLGIKHKLGKIEEHINEQRIAEKRAATIANAKQATQGLIGIGQAFNIPFIENVGKVGTTLITLEQSIATTMSTFQGVAQGGMAAVSGIGMSGLGLATSAFSCLAGPIGIAGACIALFAHFSNKSNDDGMLAGLKCISEQLQAFHKEMRECFQITWDMLNTIEQRNCERFNMLMAEINLAKDELSHQLEVILKVHRDAFVRIESKLGQLLELTHHISDQDMHRACVAASTISAQALPVNLDNLVASIYTWLTVTAVLPERNGFINVPEFPSPNEADWNRQLKDRMNGSSGDEAALAMGLGFQGCLAASIVPGRFNDIKPNQFIYSCGEWLQVLNVYKSLIEAGRDIIANGSSRNQQSYIRQFNEIRMIAQKNLQFIEKIIEHQNITALIQGLTSNYQLAISGLVKCVFENIELILYADDNVCQLKSHNISPQDILENLTLALGEKFADASENATIDYSKLTGFTVQQWQIVMNGNWGGKNNDFRQMMLILLLQLLFCI